MALARFISAPLKRRDVEIFGDREQVREMTYVADVVDVTVAALGQVGGKTPRLCNIGSGTRTTLDEMLDAVRRATQSPTKAGYGPAAKGEVRSTWADLGRVDRELGYRPRSGFEEGVQAQAEWALKKHLAPSAA